jgi:hypothetical protein
VGVTVPTTSASSATSTVELPAARRTAFSFGAHDQRPLPWSMVSRSPTRACSAATAGASAAKAGRMAGVGGRAD